MSRLKRLERFLETLRCYQGLRQIDSGLRIGRESFRKGPKLDYRTLTAPGATQCPGELAPRCAVAWIRFKNCGEMNSRLVVSLFAERQRSKVEMGVCLLGIELQRGSKVFDGRRLVAGRRQSRCKVHVSARAFRGRLQRSAKRFYSVAVTAGLVGEPASQGMRPLAFREHAQVLEDRIARPNSDLARFDRWNRASAVFPISR